MKAENPIKALELLFFTLQFLAFNAILIAALKDLEYQLPLIMWVVCVFTGAILLYKEEKKIAKSKKNMC